ncbi:MAG: amino acid ABC transporter substrate-binding protein [Eggerthellaceae bacterium]|nr:amino acid ABC transporter substrate-binding protein [Eggerthellaceae bacterium]
MVNRKWKLIGLVCASLALVAAFALVGCSSSASSSAASSASASASSASSDSAASSEAAGDTVTAGVLTIATGNPAWPPYVMNDDPESGEGFEAALAYAVAEKMGYTKDQVVWVRTGFDEAITPGAKDWDMNIQQFGITEDRKQAVDFSSAYFTPTQAIVVDAAEGHDKFANATSCADLADAVIGAEAGSTSYTWGMDKINGNIQVFNSNADAAAALNAHQIDGIILDTPTAVYMADPEMEELASAKLIGQIEGSEADPLAFLLPKDSKLTAAVSAAIDELKADGTLQKLTDQWMAAYTTDVPVLK